MGSYHILLLQQAEMLSYYLNYDLANDYLYLKCQKADVSIICCESKMASALNSKFTSIACLDLETIQKL